MKKINIIILVFLMLGVSMVSCIKQLEEKVYSDLLAANAYETEEDAEALILAIYVALRGTDWGAYYEYDYMSLSESGTDTYGLDEWEPGSFDIEVGTWDNNQGYITNLWDGAYKVIGTANFALHVLPDMDIDQNLKNRLIGEAKFLRGLAYYDLAFNFGDVILNIGESTGNLPLSPQADVIDQVIKDFTEAAEVLGGATTPGRASKGAALGMRAKTYLNIHKWQEAADDAKAVMNLGDYELMPSIEALFDAANNTANEWIFAVISMQDGTNAPSQLPWFSLSLGYYNGGWGRLTLAPDFYKSFDINDDRRKLLANGYQAGNQGMTDGKFNYYALPGTPEYDPLANDSQIHLFDLNSVTTSKYLGGQDRFVYANASFFGVNYPVLRYADILLTRAEALNELGNTNEALTLVNEVRARANVAPLAGLDQGALRDAILEERAKEFFMEGKRRIDLIRAGKYIEKWKANLEAKYPGENFDYLNDEKIFYPIPQKEIDANDQINN